MTAPEKNEVTENDLFSALGISVGGPSTSSKPKSSSDAPKTGKKDSRKKSSGDLGDDALLDIFISGSSSKRPSPSRSAKSNPSPSSSKKRSEAVPKQASRVQQRKVDPKRDAERAAQLREKAIRSRQWKEELQRKRREQEMMGSDGAKSVSLSDRAAERNQEDEIITVAAVESKKALLEDTTAREIREGSFGESHEKRPTSQPSETRDSSIRSRFSSYPAPRYTPAPNPWTMQSQQAAQPQNASQIQQGVQTQYPASIQQTFQSQDEVQMQQQATRNEAYSSQFARREASAHYAAQTMRPNSSQSFDAQPEAKMPSRSQDGALHGPLGGASSVSGDMPEADPRMQLYPDVQRQGVPGQFSDPNYQQILMQQYCDPAADYSDDYDNEPATGGTSPLGIILIVLAVLCVLVAASLLTGLWDISNLR